MSALDRYLSSLLTDRPSIVERLIQFRDQLDQAIAQPDTAAEALDDLDRQWQTIMDDR